MLDEAIPLFERTLADYEQVLGPDHPGTLRARNHLALAYDAVGRFSESVPLYERTLAAHERTMGTDDPHVETLRKNLARAQGAYRNNGDAC
jgi:tetratricopeptide (TPR) repeat protein